MKNKNGQVLVLFLLLIPFLLLLVALIIDTANLYIEKRSIENEVKNLISFRFDSDLDEVIIKEKIKKELNDKNGDVGINISPNYIEIDFSKKIKTVFSIFKESYHEIDISYYGSEDHGTILIKRRDSNGN